MAKIPMSIFTVELKPIVFTKDIRYIQNKKIKHILGHIYLFTIFTIVGG